MNAKKFGRVAVLMGGTSSERNISLESGQCVLDALLRLGVDAYSIDVDERVAEVLYKEKPDRAFIVLHGTNGEDGVVQSLLDCLQIPYASTGAAASLLTMNKVYCKSLLRAYGIPVQSDIYLHSDMDCSKIIDSCSYPLCVKPIDNGSSYGVSKVEDKFALEDAIKLAGKFSSEIMLEPWVDGREFAVPVLDGRALPVVEIVTPEGEFYDYAAKYEKDTTQFLCPAPLNAVDTSLIQGLAEKAFSVTGCRYWARVDFLQDKSGNFYCLEVNTIPGMTSHSLVPMSAKEIGCSFDQLVWKILALSYEE
ncbi:MAG: D-alanine--D-alanine ligase [Gammaproteobacteria bacterium]|nr:D-alanine--D-alanine ligase [Gammaproteobacteria bacterium]